MFKTLRARLFFSYLLLVVLIMAILGTAFLIFYIQNPMSYRDAVFDLRASLTALEFRTPPGQTGPPVDLLTRIRRTSDEFEVRIMLFDLGKKLEFDSAPENNLKFPLDKVQQMPPGQVQAFKGSDDLIYLYTVSRLPERGFLVSIVERPDINLAGLLSNDSFIQLFQAGAIAILISVVLAWLIGRWIIRPMNAMQSQFKRLIEGEGVVVNIHGPAEFSDFIYQFNQMADQVTSSQRSQKDFVANVSHELKTPLTSIQGFSQAMMDGTVQSEEDLKKSAGIIFDEAGRMHRMVIDLLDLAKFDAGTMELIRTPLDMGGLLKAVIMKLGPLASEKKIRLARGFDELPKMIGDGDRMNQVFTNLVENAIKFTEVGGEVRVDAWQEGGYVYVKVKDLGPGIPEEEVSRLFERFYQIDKSRKGGRERGAGLGLAITKQIVEAHKGEIAVRSKPGKGSEFIVRVPAVLPTDETLAIERKNF